MSNLTNNNNDYIFPYTDELKFHIVMDLCKRKGEMLDKWVAEIYDIDSK